MNVVLKGGEMMRAIDILFDEIDKINTEIKKEEDMYEKLFHVYQIKQIIEIIESIDKQRIQSGADKWI